MCVEKIEGIVKEKPMATKKKILYIVEAMGGGVFTYIVDTGQYLSTKDVQQQLTKAIFKKKFRAEHSKELDAYRC